MKVPLTGATSEHSMWLHLSILPVEAMKERVTEGGCSVCITLSRAGRERGKDDMTLQETAIYSILTLILKNNLVCMKFNLQTVSSLLQ